VPASGLHRGLGSGRLRHLLRLQFAPTDQKMPAGLPDPMSGRRPCRATSGRKEGLVNAAKALDFCLRELPAYRSMKQLVEGLVSGCAGGELSLHSGLGARGSAHLGIESTDGPVCFVSISLTCRDSGVRRSEI
jgi:hypothetical protein